MHELEKTRAITIVTIITPEVPSRSLYQTLYLRPRPPYGSHAGFCWAGCG